MNKLNLMIPAMFTMMMLMIVMITWTDFHPTHMIIILIMYSMIISMNLSLLKKNFLYSIMLFLIMISGILIIFMYFSSLISNEKIKSISSKKMIYMTLITMLSMLILWKFKPYKQPFMKSMEIGSMYQTQTSSFNNLEMIYTYPFNSMSILCMTFLLMVMLSVIKVISIKSSPLRKIM